MFHECADALAFGGSEAGKRLVEEKDAGAHCKREAHVEQALPAVGEGAGFRAFNARHPEIADYGRGFARDRLDPLRGIPEIEAARMTRLHGKPYIFLDA